LLEFDKNRRIKQQKVLVFDKDNIKYGIILVTNFLPKAEIKLNYLEGNMEWFDFFVPLCSPQCSDLNKSVAMKDMFHIKIEDKLFGEDWLKFFVTKILDTKFERTDEVEVMKGLTHLNAHQKADLLQVLQENDKMFDGTLGAYPHKKVHIDINPDAKPVHSRPYPILQIHLKTFKMELNCIL
jgi:hypothetical protein